MKLFIATLAGAVAFCGAAQAQQAVAGIGAIAGAQSATTGQTQSASIAAPGAGLTFGFADNQGTATAGAAAAATPIAGVVLTGATETNTSTTAGGSLGTAASASKTSQEIRQPGRTDTRLENAAGLGGLALGGGHPWLTARRQPSSRLSVARLALVA